MPLQWEVWVRGGCSPGDAGAAALLPPPSLGDLPAPSPGFDLVGDFRCLPARWLPGNPAVVVGWLWLRAGSPVPDTRPVLPRPLPLGLWLRFATSGEVLWSFCSRQARRAPGSLQPLRGKGPTGTALCFHLSVLERGGFGSLGACPFAALLLAQVRVCRCPCAGFRGPRAKCRGRSREQLPPLGANVPASPSPASRISVPVPPSSSIPLPLLGEGQVSPLSPCPRFGRCPLDSGCRTPSRSRQSLFCRGQSGAGGAGLGRVPPNTNQEGERVYPSSWGGTAGSVHCKIPPPPQPGGTGRGKGGLSAAPGNKESVWLMTALRKRGETNVPLIGGEVT